MKTTSSHGRLRRLPATVLGTDNHLALLVDNPFHRNDIGIETWVKKEKSMKTKVGLWIDHRKANIVTVTDKGQEMGLIVSKVERQPRRSGDSPLRGSYGPHQVPAQDSLQRTLTEHLNIYYDAVIASIRDAESVLIFGPGEAKGELKERLEKNGLGGRIVGIETADKMTDRQIAAKVRKQFPPIVPQENVAKKGDP